MNTARPFLYVLRCLNWVCRFRKRCGYGIHSPFAFGFVTGVIYEKGEYYAYAQLERAAGDSASASAALRRKDLRLLFRLANCQRPPTGILYGMDETDACLSWLKAGSCHTLWKQFGSEEGQKAQMVVAAKDWPRQTDQLLASLEEGGMLVVFGLWQNAQRREAWKRILADAKSVVSFDLRDFGIVFYRPDLNREHYRICYF